MNKKLGSILITMLGLLLLVYSASRSLDFIAMTLPPDKQILAFFGLAALDGGLIAWMLSFMNGSRGWQRPIALIMVIVDFLGAVAMFTLDTLMVTGLAGLTAALTADQIQTAELALSLIIAVNVGAVVFHHLVNPDSLRRQAEEEAKDKIESLALLEISQNAAQLAHQLAPQIGRAWRDQTEANYQNLLRRPAKKAELPEQVMHILAQETTLVDQLPETGEVLPEKTNPTKPARRRS